MNSQKTRRKKCRVCCTQLRIDGTCVGECDPNMAKPHDRNRAVNKVLRRRSQIENSCRLDGMLSYKEARGKL